MKKAILVLVMMLGFTAPALAGGIQVDSISYWTFQHALPPVPASTVKIRHYMNVRTTGTTLGLYQMTLEGYKNHVRPWMFINEAARGIAAKRGANLVIILSQRQYCGKLVVLFTIEKGTILKEGQKEKGRAENGHTG